MQITQEKIEDLNSLVRINVETEDYESNLKSALKSMAAKANMKGFRPGKVPTSLIKKMHGNQILAEEIQKLVNDELVKYLKENDIQILGDPLPIENQDIKIDVENLSGFEFVYELGLSPDFDLSSLNDGTTFSRYRIQPDEGEIDAESDRVRLQYGEHTHPDDIEEKDVLKICWTEVDDQDTPIENGLHTHAPVAVDLIKDEELSKEILKLKKGDSLIVEDIVKAFDKEREQIARNILNLKPEDNITFGDRFKAEVEEITRTSKAPLEPAFFDKLFGEGVVKMEDEFHC